MRDFQGRSGTLARLSTGAKALYLSFNLLTVLGFATALLLYWDSLGLKFASVSAYYLGNDDPDAMVIAVEKTPRYLLEITHQHLFSMPVVMVVLGHLFLLARGGPWKTAVVIAAPVLTILHLAGPWIVRYGGSGWAWWMPVTAIPYVAVYVFMALWPLPDVFSKPEARGET